MISSRQQTFAIALFGATLFALVQAGGGASQHFNPKEFKLDDKATWKASGQAPTLFAGVTVGSVQLDGTAKRIKFFHKNKLRNGDLRIAKLFVTKNGKQEPLPATSWKATLRKGTKMDLKGFEQSPNGIVAIVLGLVK